MGRKKVYTPKTRVYLRVGENGAKSKLQAFSERRAVIDLLLEHKGVITLERLNEELGHDMRVAVESLVNANWVVIEAPGAKKKRSAS